MTSAVNLTRYKSETAIRRLLNAAHVETSRSSAPRATGRLTESRPASSTSKPDAAGYYTKQMSWSHVSSHTWVKSYVLLKSGSGYDERTSEAGFWYPGTVGLNLAHLKDDAIRKAASKAGANVRQMNVFFREANEVIRLAKQFGNGVQSGLHTLIDRLEKDPYSRDKMRHFMRNGWREAPGVYLAYIFGVAPLAEDLQNAVTSLNDLIATGTDVIVSLKGKVTSLEEYAANDWGLWGGVFYKTTVRRESTARAKLQFRLPVATLGAMNFVAPFSVAYETTRLSFVLDYILPIGPWLAAVESCQIAPYFLGGTVSLKVMDVAIRTQAVASNVVAQSCDSEGGFYRHYQREVLGSFPYLTVLKPPRFKLPGIQSLGVVAALVGQRLNTLAKVIQRR